MHYENIWKKKCITHSSMILLACLLSFYFFFSPFIYVWKCLLNVVCATYLKYLHCLAKLSQANSGIKNRENTAISLNCKAFHSGAYSNWIYEFRISSIDWLKINILFGMSFSFIHLWSSALMDSKQDQQQ